MTSRLELRLLGTPQVQLDGEIITGFRTSKVEALLYFLAVTRRLHSRERLVDLLWSEMPEAKAKRNLTQILSLLRKQFQSHLLIEPQFIGFQPEADIWLDVNEFVQALQPNEVNGSSSGPLRQAVELYHGDFL